MIEEVTKEKLSKFGDVSDAIKWANAQKKQWPSKPFKPILCKDATADEADEFARDLRQYEKDKSTYDQDKEAANKYNADIDLLIIDLIQDKSGLNDIPEQYRKKVYYKAYQDGHAHGYYEVYLELCELVDLFK